MDDPRESLVSSFVQQNRTNVQQRCVMLTFPLHVQRCLTKLLRTCSGGATVQTEVDDVARKPNPKKEPMGKVVGVRLPDALLAEAQDGVRVLGLIARYSGEDAPDISKALRRFVRLGLDVTFHKVGGRPQSEADWEALEQSLASRQSN
ncbi:MAG: hypothetical protein QM817_10465 [Archangium sp.]